MNLTINRIRIFSINIMVAFLIAISLGLIDMFVFVKVGFLAIHNVIILLCFVILLRQFIDDFNNQRDINRIILMFFLFFISKNIYYLVVIIKGELLAPQAVVIGFFQILFFVMVFYIAYWLANNYKKLYAIVLLFLTFSALIGFFEHPLTPMTYEFVTFKLENFGGNLIEESQVNAENVDNEYFTTRPSGPYGNAIRFSYVLVFAGILSLYMYNNFNSKIYFYLFLLFFLVICLNMTRSAIIGMLILAGSLLFYRKEKWLYVMYIFLILTGFIFVLTQIDFSVFSRLSDVSDNSSAARLPMLLAGIVALFKNPFGVTLAEYDAAKHYVYIFYPISHVLHLPSHNGIINIGMQYGLAGVAIFFMFISNLFVRAKMLNRNSKIFWISAFLGYLAQGMFHNDFIFIGDYYGLILLGLFCSDLKMAMVEKVQHSS